MAGCRGTQQECQVHWAAPQQGRAAPLSRAFSPLRLVYRVAFDLLPEISGALVGDTGTQFLFSSEHWVPCACQQGNCNRARARRAATFSPHLCFWFSSTQALSSLLRIQKVWQMLASNLVSSQLSHARCSCAHSSSLLVKRRCKEHAQLLG